MNLKKFFHPLTFVIILVIVFFLIPFIPFSPAILGIIPRDPVGIIGIFTSPLIHANPYHLFSNGISILILGSIMYAFYPKSAPNVMILSYFIPNVIIWLIGRPAPHVGASGLVYGIAFFLFLIGFLRKDFTSTIVSLVVIFFYGSIFFGIIPTNNIVSWEGHLGGALTGISCAILFRNPRKEQ